MILLSYQTSHSQVVNREVGLKFSSLTKISGLVYKISKKENSFIKLSVLNMSFNLNRRDTFSNYHSNLKFAVGFEKRKDLNEKFQFIHGFEPYISGYYGDNNIGNQLGFGAGLGYILGFQYKISEHFYLNTEVTPSIYFNYSERNYKRSLFPAANSFHTGFNLSKDALAISFIYRI